VDSETQHLEEHLCTGQKAAQKLFSRLSHPHQWRLTNFLVAPHQLELRRVRACGGPTQRFATLEPLHIYDNETGYDMGRTGTHLLSAHLLEVEGVDLPAQASLPTSSKTQHTTSIVVGAH